MIIRAFEKEDTTGVMELFDSNCPKYFAHDEREDFILYLKESIDYYYVMLEEDQYIACGGVNRAKEKGKYCLSWGMVDSKYHGKGIGTALVRHRIQEAKKLSDFQEMFVRTSQFAFPFYEKFGFELKSTEKDFWAKGYDMYYMVLEK